MINTLYYGDNLRVLRDYVADDSVDLIYLDPPFNSNASYNVLFRAPDGHSSQAQIEAFDDTWHWTDVAEKAFDEVMSSGRSDVAEMLRAMRQFLGDNDMMAYLAMMAVRLIELHRVLKPTGSLYLHCDPTASHYLKILLDSVFGKYQFANEIIWLRYGRPKGSQFDSRRFGRSSDVILFYKKSDNYFFDLNAAKRILNDSDLEKMFPLQDEKGRYMSGPLVRSGSMGARPNLVYEYNGFIPGPSGWRMVKEKLQALDEAGDIYWTASGQPRRKVRPGAQHGAPLNNVWTDIDALESQASERLGYPTQKPVALLERILSASSNEGDLVLDPFCGCGTTVHAAQKLNRRWIGIDVTHLAIGLIRKRLKDAFPAAKFEVVGVPRDLDGARTLAAQDKYEFQKWALSMIDAVPYKGGKKGGDGGVDGYLYFKPDGKKTEAAIVSVKGGAQLTPAMVKDLIVTVDQQKAKMGIFLTLEPPTKGMISQAAAAGFYKTEFGDYPKIQIVTVEQLFQPGNPLKTPWQDTSVFKKAKREASATQTKLDL